LAMDEAAGGGHVPVVRWLTSTFGASCISSNAFVKAAAGGHVNVMGRLAVRYFLLREDGTKCIDAAAGGGHLDVLQWMHWLNWSLGKYGVNDRGVDETVASGAARGGHVHVLKWLQTQRPRFLDEPVASRVANNAARAGHTHVLQWLLGVGVQPKPVICAVAAYNGQVAVLKWLREKGLQFSSNCLADAIRGGHCKTWQWLLDENCPHGDAPLNWGNAACCAAANGELAVLQTMHLHGVRGVGSKQSCFLDDRICSLCIKAAKSSNSSSRSDVLSWLHQINPLCHAHKLPGKQK